jgi:hypothetical protein
MNTRFMARFGVSHAALLCSMSAEGQEALGTSPAAEAPNAAVTELKEKFDKKGKVVSLVSDDTDAFISFAGLFTDENGAPTYKDYTDKLGAEFDGMALVKTENEQLRLIGIASMEAALSDPTVRKALYKVYVSRVVNNAQDDETNPASFLSIAGAFKQKFDLDAFKFQQKVLTKILREQGLSGVTNKSLQMAFASTAFALTQFPRVKEGDWDKLIGMAEGMAAKHGYDTSIFDHWKATRAVASGDTSELELDFGALSKEAEEIVDAKEAEEKTAAPTA